MMFLEELMKQKEIIQRKLGLEGIEGKAAWCEADSDVDTDSLYPDPKIWWIDDPDPVQ